MVKCNNKECPFNHTCIRFTEDKNRENLYLNQPKEICQKSDYQFYTLMNN